MLLRRILPRSHVARAHYAHSGGGSQNVNAGSGQQRNFDISGGSGNQMFNAETMNVVTSQPSAEDKITTCRNALFLTDPEIDRAKLIEMKGARTEGTCEWLLADGAYQSWSAGESRLLWIHGSPGIGKTMLSIFLTQELQLRQRTIFYFCSSDDERRKNASDVLRGLLWQLTVMKPDVIRHMFRYVDHPDRLRDAVSSPEILWRVFTAVLQEIRSEPIFCVLDGLDECTDDAQQSLVRKLTSLGLMESEAPKTHNLFLAIVSRDIAGLKRARQIRLDPDHDHISGDIKTFVVAKVRELSALVEIDEQFCKEIEDALLQRAEGTFLWIGFAMCELLKKRTQKDIETALDSLPKGLARIYGRILLQIEPANRPMSIQILRWIALAVRPLKMEELTAALSHKSPGQPISYHHILERVENCYPFVRRRGNEVALVHESAKSYLLRDEADPDPVLEQFRIQWDESHLQIARTCLDIVLYGPLRKALTRPELSKLASSTGTNAMLEYAVRSWPTHARLSSTLAPDLLKSADLLSAQKSLVLRNWWNVYLTHRESWAGIHVVLTFHHKPLSPCPPLLHVACRFGIDAWVQVLLESEKRETRCRSRRVSNRRDKGGLTPLTCAAQGGHVTAVRLLVERGVDINQPTRYGKTALSSAISYGHTDIAEILLSSGARVNDMEYPPLLNAAQEGNDAVANMLLDRGADVDANTAGTTALMAAVRRRRISMVRLLLKRGADINIRNSDNETILEFAKGKADEPVMNEIARLLEVTEQAGQNAAR